MTKDKAKKKTPKTTKPNKTCLILFLTKDLEVDSSDRAVTQPPSFERVLKYTNAIALFIMDINDLQ